MASFLDKIKVKTALHGMHHFDMSCDHITTASFMEFHPVHNKELVPKSTYKVNQQTFTRLAPMPQPTFGTAAIYNRAFFVPYRTCWAPFNDFLEDTNYINKDGVSTVLQSVPYISNDVLRDWLVSFSTQVAVATPMPAYDYMYSGSYYKLSNIGRFALKVFESLGYKINFGASKNSLSYSAMPLLSCLRIYLDWYFPSQYVGVSPEYADCMKILKRDYVYGLDNADITNIIGLFNHTNYDSDMFCAAWDRPVAPNQGFTSNYRFDDITVNGGEGSSSVVSNENQSHGQNPAANPDNTPVIYGRNYNGDVAFNSASQLSQYALTMLKKLNDFLKRNQLAGARTLDRYLARFGVQLPADALDRSYYLGTKSEPLQFGDVMSHSDTSGAALADYAGKGLGYVKGDFEFTTKEYGQFIIISSIVPKVGYVQGVDKCVKHLTRLQFWQPEFDGVGVDSITADQLYVPFEDDASNYTHIAKNIFGFLPRGYENKVAVDHLTGDYRLGSIMNGIGKDAYHLFRLFGNTSFANDEDSIKHGLYFVNAADKPQYNRIFYKIDGILDYFNVVHRFGCKLTAPMRPLYDTYDFDGNGKEITMDANGVKLN